MGASAVGLDLFEAMTVEDTRALAVLAAGLEKPGAQFLEVGSWKGHSSVILGGRAKQCGGKVYCVDHWKGNIGTLNVADAKRIDVYAIFKHNIEHMEVADYIVPMRMDSLTACKTFENESLDLVFLDADHRYVQFKQDLLAWWPKVKRGGVLCGHDCEGKYYDYDPSLRELIDAHLGEDFIKYAREADKPPINRFVGGVATNGVHPGIVKALCELWGDVFAIIGGTTIWAKLKDE